MAQEENNEEKEEVKTRKPKMVIEYCDAGGKKILTILTVSKDGKTSKQHETGNKALKKLKTFVSGI